MPLSNRHQYGLRLRYTVPAGSTLPTSSTRTSTTLKTHSEDGVSSPNDTVNSVQQQQHYDGDSDAVESKVTAKDVDFREIPGLRITSTFSLVRLVRYVLPLGLLAAASRLEHTP